MSDTPRTDFIVATSDYDGAIAIARILERENAELVATLKAARDEIQWWFNEHGCCAGSAEEVMARIDALLAKSKERT